MLYAIDLSFSCSEVAYLGGREINLRCKESGAVSGATLFSIMMTSVDIKRWVVDGVRGGDKIIIECPALSQGRWAVGLGILFSIVMEGLIERGVNKGDIIIVPPLIVKSVLNLGKVKKRDKDVILIGEWLRSCYKGNGYKISDEKMTDDIGSCLIFLLLDVGIDFDKGDDGLLRRYYEYRREVFNLKKLNTYNEFINFYKRKIGEIIEFYRGKYKYGMLI